MTRTVEPGTVGLIATAGTIDETGTLIAGTLSGNSTGATTLTGATPTTNQVATIGIAFTAAGFTLNDGTGRCRSPALSGTAAPLGDIDRRHRVALSIAGTVTASAVSLTGANVAITGQVTDGGAGTTTGRPDRRDRRHDQ